MDGQDVWLTSIRLCFDHVHWLNLISTGGSPARKHGVRRLYPYCPHVSVYSIRRWQPASKTVRPTAIYYPHRKSGSTRPTTVLCFWPHLTSTWRRGIGLHPLLLPHLTLQSGKKSEWVIMTTICRYNKVCLEGGCVLGIPLGIWFTNKT